jgi:hypothetical protein
MQAAAETPEIAKTPATVQVVIQVMVPQVVRASRAPVVLAPQPCPAKMLALPPPPAESDEKYLDIDVPSELVDGRARCLAITKSKGLRCENPAIHGAYCGVHKGKQ